MFTVLLVLATLHFSGAIEEICSITEHPTSQDVAIAESVTLRCLPGNDGNVVDWLFGPNSESIDRSKYQLTNDARQLFIENFNPSYAGVYRCVVEMKGLGKCVSKAATLKYLDSNAGFQVDPQDFTVYSGDNLAVFNCTYREADYSIVPVIRWDLPPRLKDDASVTIFSYRYTSFIQISNATLYDSITLRCFVQLPGQPQDDSMVHSNYATLFVSSDLPPENLSPFSSVPLETMYLNKGETVIAGCSQRAPTLSIPISWAFENTTEIWLKGIDFRVFPNSEIPVSIYGDFNLLVDSSLYDFHSTTFVCQFDSFRGFLVNPISFLVYDTPIINNDVVPENIEIIKKENDTTMIDILVNKDTSASVRWFYNGRPLSSDGGHIMIANEGAPEFDSTAVWIDDRDATLTVTNVTCDDGGLYQVEITNPFATVLFTFHLTVVECTGGGTADTIMGDNDDDDSFPWWIILIIILLLLLLVVLILLCLWCWRRRYVNYDAEKLEQKYHKEYEVMRGSPIDSTV